MQTPLENSKESIIKAGLKIIKESDCYLICKIEGKEESYVCTGWAYTEGILLRDLTNYNDLCLNNQGLIVPLIK